MTSKKQASYFESRTDATFFTKLTNLGENKITIANTTRANIYIATSLDPNSTVLMKLDASIAKGILYFTKYNQYNINNT